MLHVWFSAARLFSPHRTAYFFWISAGRVVQNHRQNIMKLCVIYGESTPFVRHIGFSVVKKKAAYHSAGSNVRDFWPFFMGTVSCFTSEPSTPFMICGSEKVFRSSTRCIFPNLVEWLCDMRCSDKVRSTCI